MVVRPWDEVVPRALELVKQGINIWQQFNCCSCGTKQTMERHNKFYPTGKCEVCGAVTDIVKDGCNYATCETMTNVVDLAEYFANLNKWMKEKRECGPT